MLLVIDTHILDSVIYIYIMTEEILLDLCNFLQPYLPLLNTHNVDYLTRDHWTTYVPEWIRQEDENVNLYDLYDQRYHELKPVQNRLDEFLDEIISWRKKIEQMIYTREDFEKKISSDKEQTEQIPTFKYTNRTFMSQKKEHEIDILAPIINQLVLLSNADAIIDYGSGRGYLGVQLAYNYNRYVLGIESCELTVHSGEERRKLLLKHQKEFEQNSKYQTTSNLINSETNFEKLFYETFHFHSSSFLLCGLHACGSLSCSLLYHFISNCNVHSIANVACCYHLLEEKFSPNPFTGLYHENDPCSFPLSQILIQNRIKLGRNARMLAVQSLERNQADQVRIIGENRLIMKSFFLNIDIKWWFMVSSINANDFN